MMDGIFEYIIEAIASSKYKWLIIFYFIFFSSVLVINFIALVLKLIIRLTPLKNEG